jgi:hypothetical protein
MPKGIYKRSKEQIERFLKHRNSFQFGNTVRKGKKLTVEQKERLSDSHKGIKKTEETKYKIKIAQLGISRKYAIGDKNNKWKGGVSAENSKVRKSGVYKEWRRQIFIRDEYTCKNCGETNIYLEVHHIKKFSDYPSDRAYAEEILKQAGW